MARSGEDANARLKELAEAPRLAAAEKAEAAAELRPDALHARLFRTLGEFIYLKGYRKESLAFALWKMDGVLKEAARRLGISVNQAHFMLIREVEAALEGKLKVDADLLNERARECAMIMDAKGLRVLVGKKMRAALPKETSADEGKLKALKELNGVCACPGRAAGAVKIVNTMDEMAKMRQGDVLVSVVTQPEIVVAMKKASAILTDQGGMTCHAAIVSRELKIPCVIGLKVATKWLRDGDRVEVDAANGIVRRTK
jgi:pyruvate,water dikinase